jgi:hypothetical protein
VSLHFSQLMPYLKVLFAYLLGLLIVFIAIQFFFCSIAIFYFVNLAVSDKNCSMPIFYFTTVSMVGFYHLSFSISEPLMEFYSLNCSRMALSFSFVLSVDIL